MKIDLRNQRPKVEKLPDGRLRATFVYDVMEQVGRTQAELTAQVWLAFGTVGPEDFTGLRLTQQTLDGASPNKNGSLPLIRVYEELSASAEVPVGTNAYTYGEDGSKTTIAEFLQFSTGTYTPGTVGTATAPGDASSYLQTTEAVNDGTLRRIKRTYTNKSELSVTNETKNNGALLLRTIVSVKTIPSTPGGYTLVSTDVKNTLGLPTYTYTFAQGTGEISRSVDYAQSINQGTAGLTRTTIRHLVAPAATVQPTTLAGSLLVGSDYAEQDGHRIWTTTWAAGTGTVSTQDDTKNNGALFTRTIRALGTAPSTPTDFTPTATDLTVQDGFNIYTYSFAKGTGQISRDDDTKNNGALLTATIRYLTVPGTLGTAGTNPIATPSGYTLTSESFTEADGHRIWTASFAQGSGEIDRTNNDDDVFAKLRRTTITRLSSLGTAANPTTDPFDGGGGVAWRTSNRAADGHRVWTVEWIKGSGEISRDISFSQSSDEGSTGITRTAIRYLSATSQATRLPATLATSVCISQDYADQDGYRVWNTTWAKGSGEISRDSTTGNNGALLRLAIGYLTASGAAQPTPSSISGYTIVSVSKREADGHIVWSLDYAKGTGQISRDDDTKNNGALLTATIRHLTVPGTLGTAGTNPITTPSTYTAVSSSFTEADGHRIWTGSYAKGSGEISRSIDYSQSSDLGVTGLTRTTIRHLVAPAATVQPTTLADSYLIGSDVSESDGHRIWTTTWAKGTGVISIRAQQRSGGLRLVTWVSLGQAYDAAYMRPAGILMSSDSDKQAGHTVWTVTTMQLAAGGADPATGTAHSFTTLHPFRYPGRAKAITTVISGKNCHDVYKSPPVDLLVVATVTITYQVSHELGAVTPALWNPDNWATIIAKYWSWSAYPMAVVETLIGYRSVSQDPIYFHGGSGYTETCLGARVWGAVSGSPFSLTVFGGPANPDSTPYSLAAEIDPEPAFVAYDGTKYYRKTVISATIPPQTALPV